MSVVRLLASGAVGASLGLAGLACAGDASQASPAGPGEKAAIVAEVGARSITLDEVDKKALSANTAEFSGMKLNEALYESRRQTLEQLIAERLFEQEAESRGVTVPALLENEVRAKLAPVTDEEVAAWYRENPGRVRGMPIEQVRAPIRQLLEQEQAQASIDAFVAELRKKTTVRVSLEPPRADIRIAAHDPTLGPPGAPIEIIEFSDFQ